MKKITFQKDAREKLLRGINILSDAVGGTMGAHGQTVIYQYGGESNGIPLVTKDGVTVADNIELEDPVENLGVSIVKDAARKTAKKAGDGTTTSTVLAASILNKSLNGTLNSKRDFIRGMEAARERVLEYLDKTSVDVDDETIDFVASISTNSDPELGPIISEAFKSVGEYGNVWYEPNFAGVETYSSIESGAVVPRGNMDPGFINNTASGTCDLENPLIFLSTSKIDSPRQIKDILENAVTNKRALLIIADVEPQVSTVLLANKMNNGYKFNIIPMPHVGIIARETMEDIAALVGAKLHGVHLGDAAESITADMCGEADFVQSDLKNTVIRIKERVDLTEHIDALQSSIDNEGNPDRVKQLRARLAMIAGGVAMVYVGAPSEGELKEKMDRVEDAIYAVRAAKEEGILPGGGVALRDAAASIKSPDGDDDYVLGFNMLLEAVLEPYHKILSNADLKAPEGLKEGWGVNVINGKKVSMNEEGIIDPTRATKEALINAVSVSKTILSTGVTINNV